MAKKITKIDELISIIKKRIEQGYYIIGQRLPSERELAEEFNTSRPTIHNALLRLQSENIIDIIAGSGAYIQSSEKLVMYNTLSFVIASNEQEMDIDVKYLKPSSIINADDQLCKFFNVDINTKLLRRYRLHSCKKMPYRIIDGYYLASLFGSLELKDKHYIPLDKWLYEQKGIYADKVKEKVNIRFPSKEEATLLKISKLKPVYDIDRLVWANDGTLFEYTHIIANALLHEFNYTYKLDKSEK